MSLAHSIPLTADKEKASIFLIPSGQRFQGELWPGFSHEPISHPSCHGGQRMQDWLARPGHPRPLRSWGWDLLDPREKGYIWPERRGRRLIPQPPFSGTGWLLPNLIFQMFSSAGLNAPQRARSSDRNPPRPDFCIWEEVFTFTQYINTSILLEKDIPPMQVRLEGWSP